MIPEKHYAVAVDGPSGAGKSTLAKAIAPVSTYKMPSFARSATR